MTKPIPQLPTRTPTNTKARLKTLPHSYPASARILMVSMGGQLGHRNADELSDGDDTDYPEPDVSPEHSGEYIR